MNRSLLYKDKPIFGLDVGLSTVKVMQIANSHHKQLVEGYGVATFEPGAIADDGTIKEPERLASIIHKMFEDNLVGSISTRRVAMAVPAAKTYTRTMTLPSLSKSEVAEAVKLEAEQYIPVPIDNLYMDYQVINQSTEETELLAIAVPKKIVDSYVSLSKILGLEVAAIEPTISAASRLFVHSEPSDIPTILIDFGSVSSDITIFDKTLIVTGTVAGGGDNFTDLVGKKLGVTPAEAHIIKVKYGLALSKKQAEITKTLSPILSQLIKEIRRMIRYYEERTKTKSKIGQIVTMGGGANMPGLSDYMTDQLRLPVRMCDPWQHFDFDGLDPPRLTEKSMYVTVAGLALIDPKRIFS